MSYICYIVFSPWNKTFRVSSGLVLLLCMPITQRGFCCCSIWPSNGISCWTGYTTSRTEETEQWLAALAALLEDWGLAPNTDIRKFTTFYNSNSWGSNSSDFQGYVPSCTHTQMQTHTETQIKINLKNKKTVPMLLVS